MSAQPKRNLIGQQVRALRRHRHDTQRTLAENLRRAGFQKATRSWVAKVEVGQVAVNDQYLAFLAGALRAPLAKLMKPLAAQVAEIRKNFAT